MDNLKVNIALLMALALAAPPVTTAGGAPKAPATRSTAAQKQQKRKQFALNVVRNAVALPQPDPQDRLRVLSSASSVASTLSPKLARQFAREGVRLEAELITQGVTPAASVLTAGALDCDSTVNFVESIPATEVQRAEDSLLAAVSFCGKKVLPVLRSKLEAAKGQGVIAARPMLAAMEMTGPSSRWSQQQFSELFESLPREKELTPESPNFAAMYIGMAQHVDPKIAANAGLDLLEWLSHMEEGGPRNLAVNMLTDAMKEVLGEKAYGEALERNVVARSVAQGAGQPGEVEHEQYESVSVLQAMGNNGKDRTEELNKLPASLRAREAAAHGFATGTEGDKKSAERYFDMAFSAVNEVWNERGSSDATAVIEEVSEAAAHVDAVNALARAQKLDDPTAQAIGMLAIARVVLGAQEQ